MTLWKLTIYRAHNLLKLQEFQLVFPEWYLTINFFLLKDDKLNILQMDSTFIIPHMVKDLSWINMTRETNRANINSLKEH